MPWIKRNLAFVISLAVAVVLIGAGVVYLLSGRNNAETASTELEAKKGEYDTLINREPYPSQKNIDLSKAEQVKMLGFKTNALATFSHYPTFGPLDDASFKAMLVRTIADLEEEAERKGVKLPAGASSGTSYNFTFDTQRRELRLPPNTLEPLAVSLNEIRDICHVLFSAKIHSLISIKRAPIGTNETAGSGDLLTKKSSTNTVIGAGIHPFQVQFQCFSSELGGVLSGFVASTNAYVLKTLNVERGTAEAADAQPMAAQADMTALAARMQMMNRYGLGNRAAMPQPVAQPAAGGKVGEIVLEQKPIKVTLGLEAVRLINPPAAAQSSKAPKLQ